MPYFTKVLINCQDGGDKVPQIVRTDLPLADLLERGKPYAYSTIHLASGTVNHYDPAKDTHPEGPICVNFENIIGEISEEERTDLYRKIMLRDQQHTLDVKVFLRIP